jgi:hypothetical protein
MEPIRILQWEGAGILAMVFGLVLYKAAGRREWWRGVLRIEDLQLLAVTVAVSAKVVMGMVKGTMPGVGSGWLVLFGVSGGVYGAMKGLKMRRTR